MPMVFPPSPPPSSSSALSILPSFLLNPSLHLPNSTPNLTVFRNPKASKTTKNSVSERAINSVQTHQLFSSGSRFRSQIFNFAICVLPYWPSQVSLMVLSEFGSVQVAPLDSCFRLDCFVSVSAFGFVALFLET
ncbi:unnamed protein product [Sphenostylis stenocarpa]|uniref:Uncharacterized protein n=1 Tax=Sphenostylis stenocarpa TaxID=92480 RepID=A0AA86S503_9FABA|nr:unnamed protein product [Sphenostylis stenocarpa]